MASRSRFFVLSLVMSMVAASWGWTASWSARGVLSDACQCELFCPCEFMSIPTYNHCDDAAILHIEEGSYGDVKLDGLSVAVVSQSREGKRLVDTVGDLSFARIFVPDTATEEQAEALAGITRRVFGAFVGETARISPDEMVSKVKMNIEVSADRHRVVIPEVLDLEIEPVIGGDGESPIIIENNPFTAFGFGPVTVSRSRTYRYTHDGRDWNYGGKSASMRSFEMSGDTEPPGSDQSSSAVEPVLQPEQQVASAQRPGCCHHEKH